MGSIHVLSLNTLEGNPYANWEQCLPCLRMVREINHFGDSQQLLLAALHHLHREKRKPARPAERRFLPYYNLKEIS